MDGPPWALNYELDVEHGVGYRLFLRGKLIDEGDRVILVRKDKAVNGTDGNINDSMEEDNDAANCAQANAGTVPTGALGVQQVERDHGGVLTKVCTEQGNGCDPTTCTFHNESAPTYHENCAAMTAFNLVGTRYDS